MGLALVVFTRDNVRCGDMAAGTLLVYERSGADALLPEAVAARVGTLDAAGAEIVADLLQRWPTLMPEARVRLARAAADCAIWAPPRDLSDGDELQWRARLERLAGSVSAIMELPARHKALTAALLQSRRAVATGRGARAAARRCAHRGRRGRRTAGR